MGSESTRKLDGFVSVGGEAPYIDPNKLVIVGLDIEATDDNWFAHCARLEDEKDEDLADYVSDLRKTGKTDDPVDVFRDGDKLVVLDGRRTTRAARIVWAEQAKKGVKAADRITVRALIRKGPPEEMFRINVDSHKKKPLTRMQTAKLFLNFHQRHAEDTAKTATFFDVTEQTVKNTLKLFDLAVAVQEAVNEGTLPLREAIRLAEKPRAEQKEILDKMIASGATKGAAASNAITKAKKGKDVGAKADKTRMRPRDLLDNLVEEISKTKVDDRPEVDAVELIRFLRGEPPSRGIMTALGTSLAAVGFKEKGEKKTEKKAEKAA